MKRMPGGTVSPGRSVGQPRDDGGDGVDPRDRAAGHEVPEAGPVEPVVEHQAGTGHERRQQAHDLGVDVEERQRVEAAVARRRAAGGPPRSAPCAAACSWSSRTTLGVPVVPDEDRTTPPGVGPLGCRRTRPRPAPVLEVLEAVELDPLARDAGRARVGRPAPRPRPCAPRAPRGRRCPRRHGGIERSHPEAGGHGSEEDVGERHGVADRRGRSWSARGPGRPPSRVRHRSMPASS